MARVVIVDDHVVVRAVLRQAMVQAGHEVVGEGQDGASGIDVVEREQPDLVLMDVSMPGIDGITATQRLVRRDPSVRVLVVTMHAEPEMLERAREAGAAGYLLKDASQEAIGAAAGVVLAGGTAFDDAVGRSGPEPDGGEDLTEREQEVLRLLADGANPREVATALSVSPRAVAAHLGQVYDKLGVASRSEALRVARTQGLLPHEGGVEGGGAPG